MDPLRRKVTVRAAGSTLVLIKRPGETAAHVVQKALLWARYLPEYPTLRVEVPFAGRERYKPDLLALDAAGAPLFWGECGVVGLEKLARLIARFRDTHLAFSKYAASLAPFAAAIDEAVRGVRRTRPVELIGFPDDADGWIGAGGAIALDESRLDLRRWEPAPPPDPRRRP